MPKKRGQNEGTIYRRQDGRWCATVSLGYSGGKRRRKSFYGATRREVQEQLTAALRDRDRGMPTSPEKQTLAQFLDTWLSECVDPSTRPRTAESYRQVVRLYLVPELGRVPLAKLAPQQVQKVLNAKLAEGKSARTVQYARAVLRRALNQALKWGLVPRNVATLVEPPRSERFEIQPLTPEQARAFLEAVKADDAAKDAAAASDDRAGRRELIGPRIGALFSVAMAVGLRLGEALGLRWQDVDFAAGTLSVNMQLQHVGGKPVLVEPKTPRARRTIVLPPQAVEALREHREWQAFRQKPFVGDDWKEWGLVFTSSIGTPLDPRTVRRVLCGDHRPDRHGNPRAVPGILEKAGLPPLRFHDLRHTCATLLLAQNIHPRVVMEILGHSQIALTMNTYSHVVPALQREAAEKMGEILTSQE